MASIKIKTGLKYYDIEDENGNIRGQIAINPTDMNLYPRCVEMFKNVQKCIDELKAMDDATLEQEITRLDNEIKQEVNKLLDDVNASSVIFGNLNCLNTIKGITLFEIFFDGFLPVIEKECKAEQKKSQARIEKYTKQVK